MRYSFQDRPVSKFGPPIWNCDKSLVARRARSAISDCLVVLGALANVWSVVTGVLVSDCWCAVLDLFLHRSCTFSRCLRIRRNIEPFVVCPEYDLGLDFLITLSWNKVFKKPQRYIVHLARDNHSPGSITCIRSVLLIEWPEVFLYRGLYIHCI